MNTNYIFLVIIIVIIIFISIYMIIKDYRHYRYSNPVIIKNTKIIDSSSIIFPGRKIYRSVDQKYGLEYTYAFWLFINPNISSSKSNILVKGINEINSNNSYNSYNIQGPGIWVGKSDNEAEITISSNIYNKYKKIQSLTISNIPISKWIHLTVCAINKRIDVYLNGELYSQKVFDGLLKQNNNDLIIGALPKPTNGFISGLQYFNSAISLYQIEQLIKTEPGPLENSLDRGLPPYLSQNFYIQDKELKL